MYLWWGPGDGEEGERGRARQRHLMEQRPGGGGGGVGGGGQAQGQLPQQQRRMRHRLRQRLLHEGQPPRRLRPEGGAPRGRPPCRLCHLCAPAYLIAEQTGCNAPT